MTQLNFDTRLSSMCFSFIIISSLDQKKVGEYYIKINSNDSNINYFERNLRLWKAEYTVNNVLSPVIITES